MGKWTPTLLAIIVVSICGFTFGQDKHEPGKDDGKQMQPAKRNANAGYFGARLAPIDEDMQDKLKLDSPMGIVLVEILKDSPAEKGGLKEGDVIRKVDASEIEGVEDFVAAMEKTKPGQVVKFTFIREGKEEEMELTLGTRPAGFGQAPAQNPQKDKGPATKPN